MLLFNLHPLGSRGFGEIDPADDVSTIPVPLALPEGAVVHAVTLQPRRRSDGAVVTFRFATRDFSTGPADPDLPSTRFVQAVSQPMDYRRALSALTRGRRAAPAFGTVVLVSDGGDLDTLLTDYAWDDRPVEVRAGGLGWPWAALRTVLSGRITDCTGDARRIVLGIADPAERLRKPLQANSYAGTGGLEGGPELKGRPKPLCFGQVANLEPVPVDPANLKYQVHDGPIAGVDAVYVNGSAWSVNPSPGPGQYAADLSSGIVTLGGSAPPQGIVTADVRGDAAGTYVDSTALIVDRLLRQRAGYGDADMGGLSAPAGTIGVYFRDPVTAEAAIDRIAEGTGCWAGWSREGRFGLRMLGQIGTAKGRLGNGDLLDLACAAAPPPVWKVSVGFRRTWRVLNDNEVAGAVSAAERARLTAEQGFSLAEDPAVQVLSPNAAEMTVPGLFAEAADAQALAEHLLAWYGRPLRAWSLPVRGRLHDFDVGDAVTLTHPRFGFDAGADLFIDEIREDAARGAVTLVALG